MNNIKIVIDESVDYAVVDRLKKNDFDVYAIIDEQPSISDKEVLSIAINKNALLITEDKDFGELVFRFKLLHKGILLIRMLNAKSIEKSEAVLKVLLDYYDQMLNNFSVLDNDKLRIRN